MSTVEVAWVTTERGHFVDVYIGGVRFRTSAPNEGSAQALVVSTVRALGLLGLDVVSDTGVKR